MHFRTRIFTWREENSGGTGHQQHLGGKAHELRVPVGIQHLWPPVLALPLVPDIVAIGVVAPAAAEARVLLTPPHGRRHRDELQHVRQVQMENIVDEVGPEADGPGFFESVIRPRVEAAAR